jgi:2-methylcitrate dehydratase PrpD
MLRLIKEYGIRAADVRRVRVGTNSNMPNALIHHRPENELQAKFSMEFCMAILLLEGRAGLKEFTDEVVRRPDVQAMIEKIDFVVDDEAEAAGYHKMTTIIDIELADGRVIRGRADFGKGSPAQPMSYAEVADKFRDCAAYARVGAKTADQVVTLVGDLETLPSIDRLTNLLVSPG